MPVAGLPEMVLLVRVKLLAPCCVIPEPLLPEMVLLARVLTPSELSKPGPVLPKILVLVAVKFPRLLMPESVLPEMALLVSMSLPPLGYAWGAATYSDVLQG